MSQSATIKFQKRKSTDWIVVHCAATDASQDVGAREIDQWHRKRGFLCIGYHYVIRRNGIVEYGRDRDAVGAHVNPPAGINSTSVGICMVGGGSKKQDNNFTPEQWSKLEGLLGQLRATYPNAVIQGHRDFPGVNKWCPSFDVKEWCQQKGI